MGKRAIRRPAKVEAADDLKLTLAKREEAVAMVCEHHFPWCRAKLLHALAGAVEQGIFDDVMGELITHDDSEDIITEARNMLRGWVLPREVYGGCACPACPTCREAGCSASAACKAGS